MSKFKFLVSFAFVLCLILAMGTCAFAVDITADQDTIPNNGTTYSIDMYVTVTTNNGIVENNRGIVVDNFGTIDINHNNHDGADSLAQITNNHNIVKSNQGLIENNFGTVENHVYNSGYTPPPVIVNNYSDVNAVIAGEYTAAGEVIYNFGGDVSDNIKPVYNYYAISSNFSTDELRPLLTVTHDDDLNNDNMLDYSNTVNVNGYDQSFEAEILTPSLYVLSDANLSVKIPDGYILNITGSNENFSGTALVENIKQNIRLEFTAVNPSVPAEPGMQEPEVSNPYSVPATADNSNMPLWGALFISFAALAMLTRKKKA